MHKNLPQHLQLRTRNICYLTFVVGEVCGHTLARCLCLGGHRATVQVLARTALKSSLEEDLLPSSLVCSCCCWWIRLEAFVPCHVLFPRNSSQQGGRLPSERASHTFMGSSIESDTPSFSCILLIRRESTGLAHT